MNVSTIVDIVLCSLAVLIVLKFSIKGFVCSLLDLAKAILSLAIAFLLRIPLANLFNDLFMENAIIGVLKDSLKGFSENDPAKIKIDLSVLNNTPQFFEKFLTHFGLDFEKFKQELELFYNQDDISVVDSLAENVGGAMATVLSTIIAFVALLLGSYIALTIIFAFISHLRKFDGVKTVDRILGVALGMVIAITVLWGCTQGILFAGRLLPDYINEDTMGKSMVVSIFKNLDLVDFIMDRFYS